MADGVFLAALPSATVHLLKSSQVVTSVWSAVKELVENAIDAQATHIEVRLEDFGLGKVSVKDNGVGVASSLVPAMVQPHTTSKISQFSDLCNLSTFGFRGEALASLCAVSRLTIVSKRAEDQAATSFSFSTDGEVTAKSCLASKVGTSVIAESLFSNFPVRRNYYKVQYCYLRHKDSLAFNRTSPERKMSCGELSVSSMLSLVFFPL